VFGVRYRDLETLLAEPANDDVVVGAKVTAVVSQSPADKAGLRPGDVIVTVNGERVTARNPLADVVARYTAGATLQVEYVRDGANRATAVVLLSS
jgi:serine protease DegQ